MEVICRRRPHLHTTHVRVSVSVKKLEPRRARLWMQFCIAASRPLPLTKWMVCES